MKNSEKAQSDAKKHKAAEQKVGNSKMAMIEGKMHGKISGPRGKNYKGR